MASKEAPWQSFGSRLYRRGNAWYIRVQVPRDLRTAVGKGEICEALKAGDRREAERRCRQRSAEIDRELERIRKGPKDGPDINRIAQRFYQEEVAAEVALNQDAILRDPRMAAEGLYQRFEPWAESLEEDTWSPQQNAFIGEVLRAAGADIPQDHPGFPEARNKIARAWLGVGLNLNARTTGSEFRPSDPLLTASVPAPSPTNGLTITALIERYEQDRGGSWSSTTRDGYVLVFRALSEVLGPHTSIQSITRDDCRRIRSILTDLAPNYTRRAEMKGLTMEDAARVSRELDLPRRKPSSVNVYVTNLTAIFAYAETEDLIDKNPAKGLRLATKERARDRRNPFSIDQLKLIFGRNYGDPGVARGGLGVQRGGRFYVPLLSLFMGMRLNECCQLHTTDIRSVRDIPVVVIQEGGEEDGKSVKTAAGERTIPIHPELVRMGFLDHWRAAERAGQVQLFPDLRRGTTGTYSDVFGQWFGRYLKSVGAYTARTTFHSLRHTWRDALRDAQVPGEIVRALGGWEGGRDVSDDYGAGFTPERLYEAVKLVGYPGLDLGHLGHA